MVRGEVRAGELVPRGGAAQRARAAPEQRRSRRATSCVGADVRPSAACDASSVRPVNMSRRRRIPPERLTQNSEIVFSRLLSSNSTA